MLAQQTLEGALLAEKDLPLTNPAALAAPVSSS
jgi:hypothetical protein